MDGDTPLSASDWPPLNYTDPVVRGPALIIVNAVCIALCAISFLLRLFTRIFIKHGFGLDDTFIILAYMSTVGLAIIVAIAHKHHYWDRHIWEVPIAKFPGVRQTAFSARLIFLCAAAFTRQSLICFYYRIIANSGIVWFGRALHATTLLNVVASIIFACLDIWLCNPISAYWSVTQPAGARCIDERKMVFSISMANCVIDLIVATLPIPLVAKLQMPLHQRFGFAVLLSLGLVVVVAGAVRTQYIWKGRLAASNDETWNTFPVWIATTVEINLGVICACIPAIHPLFKCHVAPAFSELSCRISGMISWCQDAHAVSSVGDEIPLVACRRRNDL